MTLHILPDLTQGTEEWFEVRRGIVTASVVGRLLTVSAPGALNYDCLTCGAKVNDPCLSLSKKTPTPIKTFHDWRVSVAAASSKDAAPIIEVADNETSRNLTLTLAAERITGWTEETPMTSDMWRGVEAEPFAREEYAEHFAPVEQVGFMRLEEDGWTLGCSPDGLVGDDGGIEIKSPRAKTHVATVLSGEVPAHYMPQIQANLLVSGRKWWDFVSYVGGMHMAPIRVLPDPAWFAAITAACIAFEANAAQIVADYEKRVADMPQTERIDFNTVELKLA